LPFKTEHIFWWNKWTGLFLLIFLIISIPLFTIVFHLFDSPGEAWGHMRDNLLKSYFLETITLLAGVSVCTLILGVTTAWFVSNYEFPGRRYFEWLLILPLGFPAYLMAYAYTGLLDYTGLVHTFIRDTLHINLHGRLFDLMNMPGAIFILSVSLFPYVYLISRTSFLQRSKTYQEASSLLGSGKWATFFKVALPMARPAIVGGIALAGMEVLNDYGTVKYLGVNTFTTGIFRAWFSMGDATTAIYLSAILLIFVFGILYLESWQRGSRKFSAAASSRKPLTRYSPSLAVKILLTTGFTFVFFLSFGLPLLQIVHWVSLTYSKVINQEFFRLIWHSFALATGSGVLIVICSVIILYAVRLAPFKWMKNLAKITTLGYSIPGAVIAVGIMIPLLTIDKWFIQAIGSHIGLLLSGTVFALIFAYMVRFMAVGYNSIESGFQKIGPQVNEAGRILGAGTYSTLWRVDLPLIKTSILGGILLVFVDVMKELPLTLILRPFNFHTLATKAFDMATNEMIPESANAALVIILTGILPVIFLNRLIRRVEVL
jgi:iron(III) transport system permease protein